MTPDMKRLITAASTAGLSGNSIWDTNDQIYGDIVRAVLTELREATPTMLRSADTPLRYGEHGLERDEFRDEFKAMIDHILAEPATA